MILAQRHCWLLDEYLTAGLPRVLQHDQAGDRHRRRQRARAGGSASAAAA